MKLLGPEVEGEDWFLGARNLPCYSEQPRSLSPGAPVRLWIDNTGLQSAGLCLEGRARPANDYDVRGLLQLATLVIFGNKIALNGFEDDIVADKTKLIADRLAVIGVTPEILSINPVSEIEYALACKTAADSVAPSLRDKYTPDDSELIGTRPPDLPRGIQDRQVHYVMLAREPDGSDRLREIEESALRDKAIGAVDYMMAASPALREAVMHIVETQPNFEDRYSYDLNILLRYHLNHALAEQAFSKYAPAVGRAERMDRRNQYIVQAISDMVDKVVNDCRAKLAPEPLGVPSIVAALIQRSKGEPEGVLGAAMEFREHSKSLRDALQHLAAKNLDDTPESRFEVQMEIRDLGRQLRRDLGLEKAATLADAVDVKSLVDIPIISVKQVLKWGLELWKGRKTAVLTELVRASAFSDSSEQLYQKLRARATGQTP